VRDDAAPQPRSIVPPRSRLLSLLTLAPLVVISGALPITPAIPDKPQAPAWPAGREGHAMAFDAARGEILTMGGDTPDSAQTHDSLWAWSGAAWRVHSADGPGWRTLPALAFDTKRGRIILFGGRHKSGQRRYADTAHSDTWEWDGRSWNRAQVNSPGPTDHHAMAFDEARGVTVMQGGADGRSILEGSTWTFDGSRWTKVADGASGPGQRVHHAMTYDSRRQRVVLFGGFGTGSDRSADVWEWDGSRWTKIVTPGPGARSRHRLAYDAARGVTVLYGGTEDHATWVWNGSAWRKAADVGPPATSMSAMAYDARRGVVVLFGGGEPLRNELWEWDGTRWENRTPTR
jgi:hypothetical protein